MAQKPKSKAENKSKLSSKKSSKLKTFIWVKASGKHTEEEFQKVSDLVREAANSGGVVTLNSDYEINVVYN